MNGHRGNGNGRKPGDWKTVAAGRARIQRDLMNGRGVSNVPSMTEVGSAAYRRRMKNQRAPFRRAA
jgi:hypothetical protein